MVDSLTPDGLAEAIERARFALLRQGTWETLREGERLTRVEILRNAMDVSGVTMRLQSLEVLAGRSAELTDLMMRRDADFKRRLAADDAEIVRLSDLIASLSAQLATATAERDEARLLAAAGHEKLRRIRGVLDDVPAPAPVPLAEVPTQPRTPTSTTGTIARKAPRRGAKASQSITTGS